jgi:glycosyltransferase involved in cell wall biosynthesis
MDASVIVCTYNRAESLRDTLCALRAQKSNPSRQWEVIVVDNNSTDHTRKVVAELQQEWPLLRYEFEPSQGLSYARNHGIGVARGDILLFTDDDVLPEPDWLEVTLNGLEKFNADACGGYIAPIWETPPPPWLTERFYGFLAIRTDRTDDYLITPGSQMPFGANMAVKKAVFTRMGMFDTNRGRKGQVLSGGEDIELFERMLTTGMVAVFLGQSRVRHKVEAFRLRKSYFRRWRLQSSRHLAISRGVPGERRIFNIPFYLFPQFIRAVLHALAGHFTKPSDEVLHREMIVFHFLGTFQGLWQTRQRGS